MSFPAIPDAPISKVIVRMQGQEKGLLVNSRDICNPVPLAKVFLEGHNDKRRKAAVGLRAGCETGKRR